MAKSSRVVGMDQVMKNLNTAISKKKGATVGGLLEAGYIILGDCKVPVEYGNLRASGFVRKARDVEDAVEVGFSASYAVYVHENLEQKLKGQPRKSGKGVYWGPNGEPQFLARAAKRKKNEAVAAVVRHAKRSK